MEIQVLWFFLWALLWMIYFALDGFDLGVGMLIKILGKNEEERKTLVSSVGPFWDGNEVWLITAGGVTFAAFPLAYSNMFSWFYIPLFLVLVSLIVRGVAIEFRDKSKNSVLWDNLIFMSSFFASFLFGVFFVNLWAGVDNIEGGFYNGGLVGFLNFHGILGGLVFCVFFLFHGLMWLNMRVEGYFKLRVASYIKIFWYLSIISFSLFIIFLPQSKNPNFYLNKTTLMVMYIFSFIFLYLSMKSFKKGIDILSFIFSFIFVFLFVGGGIFSQYPYIIPFSDGGGVSIFDSSASGYTLKLMAIVALIFIPIVIVYQFWVYKLLYSRIDPQRKDDLY